MQRGKETFPYKDIDIKAEGEKRSQHDMWGRMWGGIPRHTRIWLKASGVLSYRSAFFSSQYWHQILSAHILYPQSQTQIWQRSRIKVCVKLCNCEWDKTSYLKTWPLRFGKCDAHFSPFTDIWKTKQLSHASIKQSSGQLIMKVIVSCSPKPVQLNKTAFKQRHVWVFPLCSGYGERADTGCAEAPQTSALKHHRPLCKYTINNSLQTSNKCWFEQKQT